jgi:hypothetical protein
MVSEPPPVMALAIEGCLTPSVSASFSTPLRMCTALPESVRDVTFMHIDTEGHDIKVLQGARRFITRQQNRPWIRIEFQPRTLSLHGSNVAELVAFMDEFRYHAMFNANNNIVPFSFPVLIELFYLWRNTDGWIDILLLP